MSTLFVSHSTCARHDPGSGHPERPERLAAVEEGLLRADLVEAVERIEPVPASSALIEGVHHPDLLVALDRLADPERFDTTRLVHIDGDTAMSVDSLAAARLAAGAGMTAVEEMRRRDFDGAFCAIRPPGHHARPRQSMGFCLLNNLAITAAALAEAGERVLVVDIDAHHGNGTQDAFYDNEMVAVVSFHEWPLYPGTGRVGEVGEGEGRGRNFNVCLPSQSTGDAHRAGIERVVVPLAESHRPDWLLVSAGFDAHRADPLTGLGLTAGDYGDIVTDLLELVGRHRTILFLEGGYDLDALADSSGAAIAALAGANYRPEAPTAGLGRDAVLDAAETHRRALHD